MRVLVNFIAMMTLSNLFGIAYLLKIRLRFPGLHQALQHRDSSDFWLKMSMLNGQEIAVQAMGLLSVLSIRTSTQ